MDQSVPFMVSPFGTFLNFVSLYSYLVCKYNHSLCPIKFDIYMNMYQACK